MWRDFTKVLRDLRQTLSETGERTGSYRPDLHYMRGPGPKWHAKYDSLYPKTAPADEPAASLHDIAGHHA
jgi:hypothetical protein